MCILKDSLGYQSNRVKENIKSAIFPEAFDRSFLQSPNYEHFRYSQFNNGFTKSSPHSLHINLGDTCNFACRMCNPFNSSKLQSEFKQLKWIPIDKKFDHWTDSESGWSNFLTFLHSSKEQIKVIHIIGGEVEFMPKFRFLIDYFIDHGLAHTVNFSFTTNGSIDYRKYFPQLEKYKRCEIGISIESVDPIADYIRNGGKIIDIIEHIRIFKKNAPDNMNFVLRTAPSLLSLLDYANVIKFAYSEGIPIDNQVLISPLWLRANMLEDDLKNDIIHDIEEILKSLPKLTHDHYINQKNVNLIDYSIKNECEAILKLARSPQPIDSQEQLRVCAEKLSQWDKLKNLNLKNYNLKLYNFLSKYGYE
jgi:hypothetical protein